MCKNCISKTTNIDNTQENILPLDLLAWYIEDYEYRWCKVNYNGFQRNKKYDIYVCTLTKWKLTFLLSNYISLSIFNRFWFLGHTNYKKCYILFHSQRSRRTLSKITILHINLFIAYILRASVSLLRNYIFGRAFVLSLNGHLKTETDYTVS